MFKDSFKYYKSRDPPPDLESVIDFSEKPDFAKVRNISPLANEEQQINNLGLKPIRDWKIYGVLSKPGLIFIENPFTLYGQRYWITRCIKDYSSKPDSKTNLDPHNVLTRDENWWDVCSDDSDRAKDLLPKLRWATLGYHHNWDTKEYSEEARDPIPPDMASLVEYFARVIGFRNYTAESAIVNYYRMNSTLSGHTDHSEVNSEAPLFSVSFGQTAIFLIGGLSRDDPADALFIRSGDVVVMSEGSRLRYHGVPKILTADSSPWENDNRIRSQSINEECKDWDRIKAYISQSRVNMNVRQVLKPGQKFLNENVD